MSPQQHHTNKPQTQYITKSLAQSPATSSIHSPMSSPHPQPSPFPHLPPPQHQQQPQKQQSQTQTATLNLQGINFSTLQGAMANFPGLQNVQVQIPGFYQPISLQLTGGSLHAVQQSSQSGNPTVSVVATGGNPTKNSSNLNAGLQSHQQQRSLLVSVPVSSANQQCQSQHTITLQPQHLQQHHAPSSTGTVVNLPTNAVGSGGTQTVVLTNNSAAVVPNTSLGNNAASNSSNTGTTMLTLPIAHLVGSGVQKLNSTTLRTTGSGPSSNVVTTTNAGGGNIIVQQQHGTQQQQQKASAQTQQATITVSSTGNGNQSNQSIQLVGTIQQGGRNIQVVGTKQLTGSRQLITQRQIGGSTLKIAAAAPINANTNTNLTSSANLTATPIVMSTQKLQLKTIKASSQQQQHQRVLNQITASQASQTVSQGSVRFDSTP